VNVIERETEGPRRGRSDDNNKIFIHDNNDN